MSCPSSSLAIPFSTGFAARGLWHVGRQALATRGDTLLHVAAKLRWAALMATVAAHVELDELARNADGETARDLCDRLGNGRVELYETHLVCWSHSPTPPPKNESRETVPSAQRMDYRFLSWG